MNFETNSSSRESCGREILAEAWRLGSAGFGTVEFSRFIADFQSLRNQPAHRRSVINTINGRLRTPHNNVLMLVDSDTPHGPSLAQLGLIHALGDERLAEQNAIIINEQAVIPPVTPAFGNSSDELGRLQDYLESLYCENRSALITSPANSLPPGFTAEHLSFILPVSLKTRGSASWQMELPYSIRTFSKKGAGVVVSQNVELREAS